MRMKDKNESSIRGSGPAVAVMLLALALLGSRAPVVAGSFTEIFYEQDCSWSHNGTQNAFFPLTPGYRLVLEGETEDDGEVIDVKVEATVLRDLESIAYQAASGDMIRLKARVWEEREFEDDELVEVSRNFVAICRETGDVFYFGEDVDDYEDGEIVGHEGAWRVGVDGALPGILFPGRFLLGAKYFQEIAPGVALDRARNVDMGFGVQTPAGSFDDCVGVIDSSALAPGEEGDPKVYCRGVGLVMDEDIVLVERGRVPR